MFSSVLRHTAMRVPSEAAPPVERWRQRREVHRGQVLEAPLRQVLTVAQEGAALGARPSKVAVVREHERARPRRAAEGAHVGVRDGELVAAIDEHEVTRRAAVSVAVLL